MKKIIVALILLGLIAPVSFAYSAGNKFVPMENGFHSRGMIDHPRVRGDLLCFHLENLLEKVGYQIDSTDYPPCAGVPWSEMSGWIQLRAKHSYKCTNEDIPYPYGHDSSVVADIWILDYGDQLVIDLYMGQICGPSMDFPWGLETGNFQELWSEFNKLVNLINRGNLQR